LVGIALTAMLVDRVFGVTTLVIGLQGGVAGGLGTTAGATVVTDLVAVVTVVATLAMLERVWLPRRRGVTFALTLMVALVGLQFGAIAATTVTGVAPPLDLALARALLLTVTTLAALRVLSALREHRRTVEALRSATAVAESLVDSGRVALGELRADVAVRVRQVLDEALAALEEGAVTGPATRLRSLADEVLRPLSHRLASEVTLTTRTPSTVVEVAGWRSTFATLLRAPVVPARVLALMATGFALLRSLVTDQERVRDLAPAIPADAEGVGIALSVDVGLLILALGELALVFLVVGWTARRLADVVGRRSSGRRPLRSWALVSLGLAGISALTVLVPPLLALLAGSGQVVSDVRSALFAFVASFVPFVGATVGVSLFAAVGAERAALEADLARQRSETARTAARVQAVLAHEQRRLARSLHADVQSTVNAAGLLLDRADREGGLTPALVDDVAARIAASVERFLGSAPSSLPVVERLAEVRTLWRGVCAVELESGAEVDARIDADTVARETIVDLVSEACANAVVHGGAEAVRVRIQVEGDEVVLDVADDGARGGVTPAQAAGGLGTEILRMSCSEFSLEVGERGGHLTARVPLG
jgi:signal transduction histidine kinase